MTLAAVGTFLGAAAAAYLAAVSLFSDGSAETVIFLAATAAVAAGFGSTLLHFR
jgi:hypothetical protein